MGTSFRDDKQKVGVSDKIRKIRFFSSIYHYLSPLFTFIFVAGAKNLFSVSFFARSGFSFYCFILNCFYPTIFSTIKGGLNCPVVQNRVQLLLKSNEC